jgi:hypothetical protein
MKRALFLLWVLVFALVLSAKASAYDADISIPCGINASCDQGLAYSWAEKIKSNIETQRSQMIAAGNIGQNSYMSTCGLSQPNYSWTVPAIGGPLTNSTNNGYRDYVIYCPNGTTKARLSTYAQASTCAARASKFGKAVFPLASAPSGNQVCADGCSTYISDGDGGSNGSTYAWFGTFKTAGGTCAADGSAMTYDPGDSAEHCEPVNGLTMCVNNATGQHCAKSSSGKSFCWSPGQEGPQVASDVTQGASRQVTPYTPTPPNPTDSSHEWSTSQSATTSDSSTSNGVTSTTGQTTNVYNNVPAGTGTGTGTLGGTTIPGGSSGTNPDRCTGSDDCTGAGSAGAHSAQTDYYTPDTATVASEFAAFKSSALASPLIGAATNFFTVSVSGACPVFDVPASAYWGHLVFSYHCSGALADTLALCGWMMLAVAAYGAFKVAMG